MCGQSARIFFDFSPARERMTVCLRARRRSLADFENYQLEIPIVFTAAVT
ncbi:MAG: hypothetical protein OJF62_000532 [Pseudolabrys sp.]|nr:hypothetical protein [Pseudolabrys sp.]